MRTGCNWIHLACCALLFGGAAQVATGASHWQGSNGELSWDTGHAELPLVIDQASGPRLDRSFTGRERLVLHDLAGELLPASSGRLAIPVPIQLSGSSSSISTGTLYLVDADSRDLESWLLLMDNGQVLATLQDVKLAIRPGLNLFVLHAARVALDPKAATGMGDASWEGRSLGSLHLELDLEWTGGDPPQDLPPLQPEFIRDPGRVTQGADMTFCQIYGMQQHARTNEFARMSIGTTSWNIGDADLEWTSGLGNRHPYIVQNLFRLEDGRFEQISASWIKHGFYALASHQCDLPDLPDCVFEEGHGAGGWLGQGCTDTYSPGLNASNLRPRSEIDPWTGEWTGQTYTGDYSLWIDDADIDPAQHPAAQYFVEGVYNVADDVDAINSIGWKPVTFSGSPGGSWAIGISGSGTIPTAGVALDAWGGTQTLVAEELPVIHVNAGGPGDSPDGRAILSVRTSDNGDGTWHYEYCLYNVDMARRIDSFELPIGPGTVIQNAGFHAPVQYDPGYSNDAWSIHSGVSAIEWSTTTNPLRWGVMYTFRFDANQPPESITAQVGLHAGVGPAELPALTTGPAQGPADCNSNGISDDLDIANGTSLDCNGNGVPDECEPDCNGNGIPDDCDIADGDPDCNGNGIPDDCEPDCDGNGSPDDCDIAGGEPDCNGNGIPDSCESITDCNGNLVDDACDIAAGSSEDCNGNGIPDECDIASGSSMDDDANGVPDECEGVCGVILCPSAVPVFRSTSGKLPGENHGSATCGSSATSPDVFFQYTPALDGSATVQTCAMGDYDTVLSIHTACPGTVDNQIECNDDNCADYRSLITWSVQAGVSYTIRVSGYNDASGDFGLLLDGPPCDVNFEDCNSNGIDDVQDIASGSSTDCNGNGIPDECDLAEGTSLDCNLNLVPDECDIADGFSEDCNTNGYPDECEFVGGGDSWTNVGDSGLAMDIPDNDPAGVSHVLTVTESFPVETIELSLLIQHSYNGDLQVAIEHLGSGTTALLVDRIGYVDSGYGFNSDGFDVRLGDGYPENIEVADAGNGNAVTGTWHPSPDTFALLAGLDATGDWRITVSDHAGADTGQLSAWSLHFRRSGNPDNDCNGNGVLDDCDIANGTSLDLNGNGMPDECDDLDPAVWTTEHFTAAVVCNKCHNHDAAAGVFDDQGDDVSPMHLWQATMMANSARDPYWRAKVVHEMSEYPMAADQIESACLSCHAPMGHLEDQMNGDGGYTFNELDNDRAGQEGVSCTLCHQLDPGNLGEASWSGQFSIEGTHSIYGPFAEPQGTSMTAATGFTPLEGQHMRDSQACASCHTLFTSTLDASGQVVGTFPEQTPVLENQNSSLSDVSCQSCHMREFADGDVLSTFPPQGLETRAPTRGHDITGGNTMMLELMRDNAVALGIQASEEQYDSLIARTERFLGGGVSISGSLALTGSGAELRVTVQNETGHKFPTGIPVRRAWLEVIAHDDQQQPLFHSGAVVAAGAVTGHDAGVEPHHTLVSDAGQVQIWEGRFVDVLGSPTWNLMGAASYVKDNRLLPAGWSDSGPHAADTAPAGACLSDPDFHAGGNAADQVLYLLPAGTASATVRLRFQSVNPQVVDAMRATMEPDVQDFLAMWDAGDRSGVIVHELAISPGALGDVSRGGRLYDSWWSETGQPGPQTDHPFWSLRPDPVPGSGAATWSCATCHGFAYNGAAGFSGVQSTSLSSQELVDLLREDDASLPGGHGYSAYLTEADLLDLAAFVLQGTVDTGSLMSSAGVFSGSVPAGGSLYQTATSPSCTDCHGQEGDDIPFAVGEGLGERARDFPWRTLHRVRFGPAAQPAMPRWHDEFGDTGGLDDLGAFLQHLPIQVPVSSIERIEPSTIRVNWTPRAGVTGYELRLVDGSTQPQTIAISGAGTASHDLGSPWTDAGNVWSIRVVAVWDPVPLPTRAPGVADDASAEADNGSFIR